MPLFRMAMYAKGIEIWCAPTVDDRDIWQATMRPIAHEARSVAVSACQYLASPNTLALDCGDWPGDRPLIRGGSVIVSPLGEILAGPLYDEEGLISAEIDLNDIVRGRYDLDVTGHYARPDIFRLQVNERAREAVVAELLQAGEGEN